MSDISEKAVVLKAFGSYNCLSVESFPLPPLDENSIEVEVYTCGLNFADLYNRQGLMSDQKLPYVLGIECAGIVTAVGTSQNHIPFEVGQRVLCYDHKGGLHQSKIRIDSKKCYLLPDHVSFEEGASIFVNYLTAYFALFDLGNLKKNENILIQSCAGGVGCAATQLAKTVQGVKVLGTTSATKTEAAKANGVDIVLSYSNLEEQIKDVLNDQLDLIIDNQSGKYFSLQQNLLGHLGRIVTTGANFLIENDKKLSARSFLKLWWNTKNISPLSLVLNNRSVSGLHLGLLAEKKNDKMREALDVIFTLLKDGKIKPIVDSVWPIEDIVSATKVLAERRNVGKVLLSLKK